MANGGNNFDNSIKGGSFQKFRLSDGNVVYLQGQPCFHRFLDTNGDGTGTKQATGNYSDGGAGVTDFFLTPPAGQVYQVHSLTVYVADTALEMTEYVTGSALSVGIDVLRGPLGSEASLISTPLMTQLGHWLRQSASGSFEVQQGNLTDVFVATLPDITKPVLEPGDKYIVRLNDDFTGLVEHTFFLHGFTYFIAS